ncbi:UbiD family decarboxylase domain-containing protein, partial [Enterobacter hormaechei subsp. xiangfangensis]
MSRIHKVTDLRSALALLSQYENELIETDEPVDPSAELSGVYRYIGAHGTVMRPTRRGPAMLFNQIKGYTDMRVLIGLLCSRKRVARLLDTTPDKLAFLLKEAVNHPVSPVVVPAEHAVCQEVVHLASDPDFSILDILPAPTNTPEDAGPYFTMGMCY